jgi:hypothetical protein
MAQSAGWNFDPTYVRSPGGVVTVRDLAGYENHGKLTGAAAITTDAKYAQALHCTGGALRAEVQQNTYPLNISGGLTLFAWVKLDDTTAAPRCIMSANSAGSLAWALYASNAAGNVELRIGANVYSTTTSIRDGAWHVITASLDLVTGTTPTRIDVDGTMALSITGGGGLTYSTSAPTIIEIGRNALSGGEPLNGIVDDVRWWNDPVEVSYWPTLRLTQQKDFLLGAFPLAENGNDASVYSHPLTIDPSATWADGVYHKALRSNGVVAAGIADVAFGDIDRLFIAGWFRMHSLPTSGTKPILTLTDTSGTIKMILTVSSTGVISVNWPDVDGVNATVTSTITVVAGTDYRLYINMNPVFVQMGINAAAGDAQLFSLPVGFPHLSPSVMDVDRLYVGGSPVAAADCSWDYLTFVQNFINNESAALYFSGPVVPGALPPQAIPVGAWDFDEGSGSSVADKSGHGNALTVTSNGVWVTGPNGSPAIRAPSTGTAAAAQDTSLVGWRATPKGMAFAAYVKFEPFNTGARALVFRRAGNDVAHMGYLNSRPWMRLFNAAGTTGGIYYGTMIPTISPGVWYHIAVSLDRFTLRMYVNGVLAGQEYASFASLDQSNALSIVDQLYVGGDSADSGVAAIDNLRIYDEPISHANAKFLYEESFVIQKSIDFAWSVLNEIQKTAAIEWDILGTIQKNVALEWSVMNDVQKAMSFEWAVQTLVETSAALEWDVLGSIQKTLALNWDVLSEIEKQAAFSWAVQTLMTKEVDLAWNIEGVAVALAVYLGANADVDFVVGTQTVQRAYLGGVMVYGS